MPDGRLSGGGATLLLHKITADHGTVTTSPEITFASNIKPDVGDAQVSLDQCKADSDAYDFFNEFASKIAASGGDSEAESVTLDDGTAVTAPSSGSASSAQEFVGVLVGPVTGSNRKVTTFVCTVDASSGSHSQEHNKLERPTVVLNLKNALQDITMDLASGTLPSDFFGTGATVTLLTGFAKRVDFEAKQA